LGPEDVEANAYGEVETTQTNNLLNSSTIDSAGGKEATPSSKRTKVTEREGRRWR
jgi:hypothetical protein